MHRLKTVKKNSFVITHDCLLNIGFKKMYTLLFFFQVSEEWGKRKKQSKKKQQKKHTKINRTKWMKPRIIQQLAQGAYTLCQINSQWEWFLSLPTEINAYEERQHDGHTKQTQGCHMLTDIPNDY